MSDLSKRLRELSPEKQKLLAQALQQGEDTFNTFPLSFAQQRLWFLDQLAPGSPAYHIPGVLNMRGALDLAALRWSLQEIARRHEILRTTFIAVAGQPVQAIHQPQPVSLPIIDLQGLPAHLRDAQARALSRRGARAPFDLSRGPLLRATLLRLGPAEHALLLTLHHIIADGWSLGVLWRELAALYGAYTTGAAALPDLAIQYADYARWQREQLQGERRETLLAYWRAQLDGAPQLLALPTDRPRRPTPSGGGAQERFVLAPTLTAALAALGQRAGATLFMTLLAGFQALLARYSGQDDLLVGTAVAGRTHPAVEPLIGCFVNTLVLRASLGDDPSFLALLDRTRATCLAAYAHQELPFEQLVDALVPAHERGHAPLVQVFLTMQSAPLPPLALPGLALDARAGATGSAKFELALDLTETADGLVGVLEYDTDLFDAATIARLAGHFQTLLADAAQAPDTRTGALPLLTQAEREQMLVEWNDTVSGVGGQGSGIRTFIDDARCIHELFAAQVARTPDAVAVIFDGAMTKDQRPTTNDESGPSSFVLRPSSVIQLTYAELDMRANQLAHHLRGLGVGPEVLVGLYMPRAPELLIALLGVLKAGGAYLPLDPTYPSERISFMLEDSGAAVLITTNDERRTTNDESPPFVLRPSSLVNLHADWPVITTKRTEPPRSSVTPDNLAYVIYTSGSTGRPKGVMITQHSAAMLVGWARTTFSEEEVARTLASTSIGFDLSVFELFVPLSRGGTVVLCAEVLQLAQLPGGSGVTLINTVPSALQAVLSLGELPRTVATINLAGEPLPNQLAQQLYQHTAVTRVVNLYGPTEDTTYSTYALVERGAAGAVPIGRPIANTQMYVLDRQMEPVPIGVPGELYIGGAGLARGYLSRPALTAAAFVPNPFSQGSGVRSQASEVRSQKTNDARYPEGAQTNDESNHLVTLSPCHLVTQVGPRLYRTGDLARYLPDGMIEYLGRIDHQIKLRGFRIELGEVEATLAEHPGVREAVVVLDQARAGRLVAYVVPVEGSGVRSQESGVRSQPSTDDERWTMDDAMRSDLSSMVYGLSSLVNELRAWLKQRLPSYMIPAAFVALDELPLTPSGKVDRKALPALDWERAALAPYTAPRTPVEERVAAIWAEVLGLTRVGIDDNFFALGGHSLLATQVSARLEAEFQVELPLRELFEAPALAGLARRIEAARAAARRLRLPPLVPTPRDRDLPLSFAQQRLWLLDQLEPGSVRYSIPMVVRLSGSLDVAALRRSLDQVVQRHETLRTTFALVDGQPVQLIAPPSRLLLPVLDLRDEPAGRRAQHAEQLAAAEALRPFDLARGPLLRVALLRLSDEEHTLLLNVHHTVFDGWSTGVLVGELAACYRAATTGAPAQLPALPIQYADFAAWQRAWLQGEGDHTGSPLQAQLAYWRAQLDGVSMLDLPTDRPRRAVPSGAGAQMPVTLPPSLAAALSSLSRRAGATMFMTLLAGFQAVLARYSGQDDIVVGTPIAGRTHPAVEPLIGCFVNPLVLRVSLGDDPSFLALLDRTRATCLAAYEHQELPFEQLVDALVPAHERGHAPLVQVFLTTQNAPLPPLALPGLELHAHAGTTGSAKYDLLFDLAATADGLVGWLEYDTDLFDAATIARLVGHFQTLLEGAVADPARRLADLPLLSEAEQRTLANWNATQAAYPHTECFHQLIEAQAAYTPDAVVLVFEGATNDERRTARVRGSGIRDQDDREPVPDPWLLTPGPSYLTYAALDRRANQLAHYLRRLQVGPEVRVGICMERSLEMVIGLLGVLKAGGAYVPLDPTYPAERLAFMLDDADAQVLVTNDERRTTNDERSNSSLVVGRSSFVGTVVDLRADWPLIAAERAESPASGVTPDNLAYMIYTSGSTGRPKGVLLAHRGVCNSVAVEIDMLRTGPGDHVLQFFSLSFDASLFEMAMTLPAGATLHLAAQETLLPGPTCVELLRRQGITIYATAPSVLAALPFESFPMLRTIIVLGEACGAELVARWGAGRQVFNAYGPTEATMWAVGTYIDGTRRVPIGRPIANAQVHLLDRRLQPVPVGVVGELYIGGVGVARGYHGRPDLTAERFIPNPFAEVSGIGYRVLGTEPSDTRYPTPDTRLYKTGDLARYLPDGEIEYLGRADAQVKIHGYRIELGEIEAVLSQHKAVHKSVVLAREDVPGEKRLVAYIVEASGVRGQGSGVRSQESEDEGRRTKDESEPSPFVVHHSSFVTELRGFLAERLPDYMIPSAFVLLDALPLSPTGKLDARALPAPDWGDPAQEDDFAAPRTPVEEVVAGIWADVLGVARVGIHDNFFEIGGHSLRATQTIARLRAAFQVELPLYRLFENPTVASLAAVIAAAQADGIGRSLPPIQPAPHDGALPLSFAQQRLWFLDQMEPESPLYLLPGAIRLAGQIDVAALRRSLAAVVARHESLRTTFTTVDGRPVQVIAAALPLPLPLIDLQPLPAPERANIAARLAAREARCPFDLACGPLLRTTLVRLALAEHILLLTMHHIISDGWSIGVFMRDLAALYNAHATHTRPSLSALPIQYADFAIWQRAWLQGAGERGDGETRRYGDTETENAAPATQSLAPIPHPRSPLMAQLAYWTRALAGAPQALALPTDRPRPAIAALQGRRHALRLAPALADALAALARRADVTLFMALLAAFQTLLARYSGQEDLLVGAPIAGRTRAETENLIGLFINTLALRGDLSGNPSFRILLERVRAVCLGAYTHQDLPFEQLVEELQPDRDLSRAPLVQVVFALQNAPVPPLTFPSFTVEPIEIDSEVVKFDLTLTLAPAEQGLAGSLGYATELFDEATISRMVGHFQNLLEGAVARPELALADLPLLSDAEQRQLLLEWNATAVGYPPDECLHQLVEAQAAYTPDAVAVVFDAELTNDQRPTINDQRGMGGACLAPTQHLTYAELDTRANQLAQHLRRLGVGPDVLVGIGMERSIELIVAVLGVLKAGGAYLPLDPSYPIERLAFMLEDSHAHVLVTKSDVQGAPGRTNDQADHLITLSPCRLVYLDADWPVIAAEPAKCPSSGVMAGNLAYVIYTSGSTGRPKGAMIPHRGIANRLRWGQDAYGLAPGDRVMQKAPFSFDASIWEIFWPLLCGARLVLARPGGQQDSAYLVDMIARQQITIAHFVPSMLQFFLAEPTVESCRSLRRIFCGGEPLPGELAERCRRLLAASLHNQYGPTETSVNATFWTCGREQPRRTAPIGRPIANMQAYVLDARLQPVPVGVAGELHLGGAGLGRGYLNRPDLTAAAFVPNPFVNCRLQIADCRLDDFSICNLQSAIYNRLYRTGDLVRYLPDGAIEFLGRIDHQVKLRGYRVEPDEVAALLDRHPAVHTSVVVVREDLPGDVRLVAYVVQGSGVRDQGSEVRSQSSTDDGRWTMDDAMSSDPSSMVYGPSSLVNELRAWLKQYLPDYMLPSAFVVLDALPLGPNGKLDRRALPAPDRDRAGLDTPFAAPRTAAEERIAQIWTDVLGLDQVGIHDNFFALGGHSLLATRVVSHIREALRVELPVRALFETPTVAGLAQAVAQREEQTDKRPIQRIERVKKAEEELLANLDQLSDAEVEALLGTFSDQEGMSP